MKVLSYEFVKEQIEKEGYKLLSTEYNNYSTKLKVQCDKGHEYEIKYSNFQRGKRCPKCCFINRGLNKRLSIDSIRIQIEKERYKLLSTKYNNAHEKLKLKCNSGHEYEVTWNKFQTGKRCPKCFFKRISKQFTLSYNDIKQKIEKEKYKLLSEKYSNAHEKLLIQCDKGHEYEVTWSNFKKGHRCPICFGKFSRSEKEVSDYIKSLNIEVIENDKIIISPLELDIVIPEKKIAIEYCGLYWHSDLYTDKNYHKDKLERCNKAGYRLITIFEDEWINKQEIVKNRLKYILGLETERIYARKCIIKKIDRNIAKGYIEKYHIQGYSNSIINIGAFHENDLVAVMTFSYSSNRGNKTDSKYDFEINRFCTNKNVVGIAGKLLEYFKKNYKYDKIITFADRRWSEGNLYEKIGMEKCYNVKPNYFYFKEHELLRYHRFNFRKNILEKKLEIFDPNKTEYRNMIENGWNRIWDCGNIKYEIMREVK